MQTPEILYRGRFIRVVRRDNWEFVERTKVCGIVGILAITPENKLILVEQHRAPVGKRVVEIPAGLAGDTDGTENEDLAEAARRELLEETGYEAQTMVRLAAGTASAGITDEIITLYRAQGLKKVAPGGGDESEAITIHEVPLAQVHAFLEAAVRQGKLVDLKVYSALCFGGHGVM